MSKRGSYYPDYQFTALMWCCKCVGGGWVDAINPVQRILEHAFLQSVLKSLGEREWPYSSVVGHKSLY
jgi:hypothetical protein